MVLAASGCSMSWLRNPFAPSSESEAVLAAARERNINLFGDVEDGTQAGYIDRGAISVRQHTFTEEGDDFDCDLSPDGAKIVFASTRHHDRPDLYIKTVDGVAVTQLTSDPTADVQPVFSPDGTKVAFASDRTGNWDIWVVSVDGGQPVQITSGWQEDVHPSWSPDGTRLVYCSLAGEGAQWELWIADAVGGGSKKFIGYGLFPSWSPTGDVILYQRARERGGHWFSIWTITLVDGEPRYPTEIASSPERAFILPAWGRDGTSVAFTSIVPTAAQQGGSRQRGPTPPTVSDIWVMGADGRDRVRLTEGDAMNTAPAFAADGRIFFTSNRTGFDNIWSLVPATANASVTDLPGGSGARLAGEIGAKPLSDLQTAPGTKPVHSD